MDNSIKIILIVIVVFMLFGCSCSCKKVENFTAENDRCKNFKNSKTCAEEGCYWDDDDPSKPITCRELKCSDHNIQRYKIYDEYQKPNCPNESACRNKMMNDMKNDCNVNCKWKNNKCLSLCNIKKRKSECNQDDSCVWRVQGGDPLWDDRTKCKSIIQAGFNMNNFEKKSDTKLKGSSESYSGDKLGPCLKKCDQDNDCKAIRYSSSGGREKCTIMTGTLSNNNNQNRGGKVYKKK